MATPDWTQAPTGPTNTAPTLTTDDPKKKKWYLGQNIGKGLQGVEQNISDRWTNNPGTNPLERSTFRRLDRRQDLAAGIAKAAGGDNGLIGRAATTWSEWLKQRERNVTGKSSDDLPKVPNPPDPGDPGGDPGGNLGGTDKAADWLGPNNAIDRSIFNLGDTNSAWKDAVSGFTPSDYKNAIGDKIADWEKNGPAGSHFAGAESGALETAGNLENITSQGQGQQILDFEKAAASQLDSPLSKAVTDSATLAAKGELTQPGSQYYEAATKQMDYNTNRGLEKLKESLGPQGLLNTGHGNQQIADFLVQDTNARNSLLAGIQNDASKQAANTMLSDKSIMANLVNYSNDLVKSTNATQLSALGTTLNYVADQTKNANAQAGLMLEQSKDNMSAAQAGINNASQLASFQDNFVAQERVNEQKNVKDWAQIFISGLTSIGGMFGLGAGNKAAMDNAVIKGLSGS